MSHEEYALHHYLSHGEQQIICRRFREGQTPEQIRDATWYRIDLIERTLREHGLLNAPRPKGAAERRKAYERVLDLALRGWSQRRIADATGVPSSTVSDLIRRERKKQ